MPSMSQLTVPVFAQGLDALAAILEKAERYAADRKIDEAALLQSRLFPDMLPFTKQVQIACDFAKGATARLAGLEVPSYADDETSFAALRARIARTLDFVRSVPKGEIDGSEERVIELKSPTRTLTFKGEDYLLSFVYQNFFFHLSTAYGLLRHSGLEIGKRDFVGAARLS